MYVQDVAWAAFDGFISIPQNIGAGIGRTFEDVGFQGNEARLKNIAENKRAYNVIRKAVNFARSDSGPVAQAVKIILTEFYDEMPDHVITEAAKSAGVASTYMTTRIATQFALVNIISKKLTSQIATKVIARSLTRVGVGFTVSALIVQGVLENASASSQRLRRQHPQIYSKLREKDLDMIYFMIEEPMSDIMELLKFKNKKPEEFDRKIRELEHEVISF